MFNLSQISFIVKYAINARHAAKRKFQSSLTYGAVQ